MADSDSKDAHRLTLQIKEGRFQRHFPVAWTRWRDAACQGHSSRPIARHHQLFPKWNRLVNVVGDEHNGCVDALPQFEWELLHCPARLRVQCAKWFIHEQNTCSHDQGPSNSHALLHAARQIVGAVFFEPFESDNIDDLVDALTVDVSRFARLLAERNVVAQGKPSIQTHC